MGAFLFQATLFGENVSENKVVQYSELKECEKNDLRQKAYERAKRKGRELLEDVVCAWRPHEVEGQRKAEQERKEKELKK